MEITFNGQTIQTKIYKEISNELYEEIRNYYYKKPDFQEVRKQMIGIANGQTICNKINAYYIKDLMAKTKVYFNKWSIEDVLNCKQLVEFFVGKVESNALVYPKEDGVFKNFEAALRLGGKGVASKPSNFPIDTVYEILQRYNINNNWYDFSCGWGDRLLGALSKNVNYYGTDPNYLLTERLKQMSNDYQNIMFTHNKVEIKTQGSEIFVPGWENKMGLAFSSPPYFALEDYKIGNQSYKEGTTYNEWINNYLKPTMANIHKYLIDTGYFVLNINNYDKYKLVEDCVKVAESVGFAYLGNHTLKNIKRINENNQLNDNSEKIMVFMKKGHEKDLVKLPNENVSQLSLFD